MDKISREYLWGNMAHGVIDSQVILIAYEKIKYCLKLILLHIFLLLIGNRLLIGLFIRLLRQITLLYQRIKECIHLLGT